MKVSVFLDNLDETFLDKIEELSIKLNAKREFKKYKDFEDIVYGQNSNTIKQMIKPDYENISTRFMKGKKI